MGRREVVALIIWDTLLTNTGEYCTEFVGRGGGYLGSLKTSESAQIKHMKRRSVLSEKNEIKVIAVKQPRCNKPRSALR